jgi:hypothetical protein
MENKLPQKILILRLSAIGDVLHATPVARELKKLQPGCHITWLVSPPADKLLAENPHIDEVLVWDRRPLDKAFASWNLPAAFRWLPKGAVLAFNAQNGKAIVVKTARVYEAAEAAATTLKIYANDLIAVGDEIGGATISAIETEDGVSTLTVSALEEALAQGDVIADANASGKILGLAYETTDLQGNDYPQVTPTLQAFEIEEDTMPFPVNDDIKAGLGALHQFKIQ